MDNEELTCEILDVIENMYCKDATAPLEEYLPDDFKAEELDPCADEEDILRIFVPEDRPGVTVLGGFNYKKSV